MPSGHAGALGGQHQIPATIQPLQTLTQSFVAKQQQQNRHGSGTYSSAFSNGPTSLQLAPSASSSSTHSSSQHTQHLQQSPRRFFDAPSSSGSTPVLAHQQQPPQSAPQASPIDVDTHMQTDEPTPVPLAEINDAEADAPGVAASLTDAAPSSASNEKRKRGRPKGSKTKRTSTKSEGHEQPHQQELVIGTEPQLPNNNSTTSPSLQHQPLHPSTSAADDASSTHPKEEHQKTDSFDPTFFSFLDQSSLPPERPPVDSTVVGQSQPQALLRNNNSGGVPVPPDTPRISDSSHSERPSTSKGNDAGPGDDSMLPVYEFYWNTMNLCSDFFQAATDLLSSTPSDVLSRALGTSSSPPALQLFHQAKALCDRLMLDPASITNAQIPSDFAPRGVSSSLLNYRRANPSVPLPWTAEELAVSSAAAASAAVRVPADPNVSGHNYSMLGASQRPLHPTSDSMSMMPAHHRHQQSPSVTLPHPIPHHPIPPQTPASHHSEPPLELATPSAPFMNPLPHPSNHSLHSPQRQHQPPYAYDGNRQQEQRHYEPPDQQDQQMSYQPMHQQSSFNHPVHYQYQQQPYRQPEYSAHQQHSQPPTYQQQPAAPYQLQPQSQQPSTPYQQHPQPGSNLYPHSQSTTPQTHPSVSASDPASTLGWTPTPTPQQPDASTSSTPAHSTSAALGHSALPDSVMISPATMTQSTSTAATSATMLPSGSSTSRPSTAAADVGNGSGVGGNYGSHNPSPVMPGYSSVPLQKSASQQGQQQQQQPVPGSQIETKSNQSQSKTGFSMSTPSQSHSLIHPSMQMQLHGHQAAQAQALAQAHAHTPHPIAMQISGIGLGNGTNPSTGGLAYPPPPSSANAPYFSTALEPPPALNSTPVLTSASTPTSTQMQGQPQPQAPIGAGNSSNHSSQLQQQQNPIHSPVHQHHRNSISFSSLTRTADVGEWTAEEVARLHFIIRNSPIPGAGGNPSANGAPETDWQKVVDTFHKSRPRHHILNKAVALGYVVPPYILHASAPSGPAGGNGTSSGEQQQQSRKRRRVDGSPRESATENSGAGTGASTTPVPLNVPSPASVVRSPAMGSNSNSNTNPSQTQAVPTSTASAPPQPVQGYPTASPHMLHSSYNHSSPSMGPPSVNSQQQPASLSRPVPPPMYNPGPRLGSSTNPSTMPLYRMVPAPPHLQQQQQHQQAINNGGPSGAGGTNPHPAAGSPAPAFLQSPVSIYPSQPLLARSFPTNGNSNGTTPAIYPSFAYPGSSSNAPLPGGAGPTTGAPNGVNNGASGVGAPSASPRVSLRSNGESSPHPNGGNSSSATGTTTRRAAAAAANAANTSSSGPTTHYSHPFVNYSAPAPTASANSAKPRRERASAQQPLSATNAANGSNKRAAASGPANTAKSGGAHANSRPASSNGGPGGQNWS